MRVKTETARKESKGGSERNQGERGNGGWEKGREGREGRERFSEE